MAESDYGSQISFCSNNSRELFVDFRISNASGTSSFKNETSLSKNSKLFEEVKIWVDESGDVRRYA